MCASEPQADRVARFLLKKVNRAVYQFGMIQDGDRIAVAVSGGKDSFSLLRVLRYRQRLVPENYTLAAVHVVGDARGPDLPPYPELEGWLKTERIEYLVRLTHMSPNEKLPMTCERCTWNRRRTLFEMAGELGCNKVAFGHHLDDLAETALLNLIHHGRLETMSPCASYFGGRYHIIRPLAYVPESEIRRYAARQDFPSPPPPCPRGEHTQRQRMKELIAEMAKHARKVRQNLVRGAVGKLTSNE